MSDQIQANGGQQSPGGAQQPQPPQQPTPGDGQQGAQQPQQQPPSQPSPPSQQAGDQQAQQPFRTFANQNELDEFVQERVARAKRSALNDQAKTLGYKSWTHMRAMLQVVAEDEAGEAGDGNNADAGAQAEPGQQQQPSGQSDTLALKLAVAAEKNLPASLVQRLVGNTREQIEADADQLLQLVQAGPVPRGPGIPPAPQANQPVTFTRQQLSDPKFVREHVDEIRQAAAEGRIVRS